VTWPVTRRVVFRFVRFAFFTITLAVVPPERGLKGTEWRRDRSWSAGVLGIGMGIGSGNSTPCCTCSIVTWIRILFTRHVSESGQQFRQNLFAVVKIKCSVLFYAAAAGISQKAKGRSGGELVYFDSLFILVLCSVCQGRSVFVALRGFGLISAFGPLIRSLFTASSKWDFV